MFEKAAREKIRFNYKGSLSVEDLWDLGLQELDSIFKDLNSKLKVTKEESLLNTKSAEDKLLALKIDLIKHIVGVKLKEAEEKKNAKEKKEKRQKLLEIISKKQDDDLQNKSIDELKKMLDESE